MTALALLASATLSARWLGMDWDEAIEMDARGGCPFCHQHCGPCEAWQDELATLAAESDEADQ